MEILLAKSAGFCFGVKRAVNIVEELRGEVDKGENIHTLGPLIHNRLLVEDLEKKGIKYINELNEASNGYLVIRSHGVGKNIKEEAKRKFKIVDATCPYVLKAQKIVNDLYEKGYQIIIFGQKNHAEVKGLIEWTDNSALVIENLGQAKELKCLNKAAIISQTTQMPDKFLEICNIIKDKIQDFKIYNTICLATKKRQEEAFNIAKKVDIMIIIGGKNSANSNKLYEIAKKTNTPTLFIEEVKDINTKFFKNVKKVGVTAGASTPAWIIKEVVKKMTEINKENELVKEPDLNNALEKSIEIKIGNIVKGKVVQIKEKDVLVDIGGKSEGVIPLSEITFRKIASPEEIISVGDVINVKVIKTENEEGHPVLSKIKAENEVAWNKLEEAMEAKEELSSKVVEVVKGGLIIDLGVRGFVPASLIERGYVEKLEEYVEKDLKVRIIEMDKEKNRIIASQKIVLDEEFESKQDTIWAEFKEGQIKKGIVKRITDFGAFLEIDGIDGLLHVSEMSYSRVNNPSDLLNIGDEIEVKIMGVDIEKRKLSLSRKELLTNPWDENISKYKDGQIVEAKVVKIANFGAFVELEEGIQGLVHISQLANQRVNKVDDIVKIGDTVKVRVLNVDLEAKKISLSIKQASEDALNENALKEDIAKYKANEDNSNLSVTLGDLFGDLFKED